MRRILFIIGLVAVAVTANAQAFRVWQNGESVRYTMEEVPTIQYSNAGQVLTIGQTVYGVAAIDSITIVNPVTISWNGAAATINVPESVSGVTYTIDGGNVIINNANTWEELEFVLTGTSTAGSLTYNGSFKTKFHLNGLNLTSKSGAALDIQCGKRIDLILTDGTDNSLTDAAGGEQKAALNCQGHLEISGSGNLTIAGKSAHGLRTKEYLLIKKTTGTLKVTAAVGDGIHCGEFYQQNGGTVSLSGFAKDGLQIETADASEEVLNGQMILNDGTLTVRVEGEDVKGIRLDAPEANADIVPEMSILGGTVNVVVASTASGSKGIASDGNITIGAGQTATPIVDVTVAADTYTDASGEENRATGIKANHTLLIAGGTSTISATGNKSRGVRAETLQATSGKLTVTNTGTKSQGIKLDNVYSQQGDYVSGNIKY